MEIIIGIFVIVGCVICFFLGQEFVEHQEKIDNSELLLEQSQLQKDIAHKRAEICNLEAEHKSKKDIILDANKIAQTAYEEKVQVLHEKYKQLEEDEQKQLEVQRLAIQEQIEEERRQLDSIKATHAATIEAFQREEQLKEQIDSYRVVLSISEENDINLLHSIRKNLSNKRVLDMLIWQTFVRDKLKEKMLIIFPKKDICGIYKLTNLKNQKVYIGQAKKIQDRINQHFKHGLFIDTPQGNKLYEAMQQDGVQNFSIELLEECKPEQLDEKERYYISVYNAVDWGYNKLAGNN